MEKYVVKRLSQKHGISQKKVVELINDAIVIMSESTGKEKADSKFWKDVRKVFGLLLEKKKSEVEKIKLSKELEAFIRSVKAHIEKDDEIANVLVQRRIIQKHLGIVFLRVLKFTDSDIEWTKRLLEHILYKYINTTGKQLAQIISKSGGEE